MTPNLRVGLIGHNIGYSKSGDIYAAVFDRLGINSNFELLDVAPTELDTVVYRLRSMGFAGAAVTIPHKQAMLSFLDHKDAAVNAIGATNSISMKASRLYGHNTDCAGFSYLARKIVGLDKVSRAAIFGNGGSARAVIYSLITDFGCRDFVIFGRSKEALGKLETEFLSRMQDAQFETRLASDTGTEATAFDLAVNCTPLGGWHYPKASPVPPAFSWEGTDFYIDLNYNDDNAALAALSDAGVTAINGAAMLVAQAIESVRLWTGKEVEFAPIFSKIFPGQTRDKGGYK